MNRGSFHIRVSELPFPFKEPFSNKRNNINKELSFSLGSSDIVTEGECTKIEMYDNSIVECSSSAERN